MLTRIFKGSTTQSSQYPVKTFVISLARTPERYEQFARINAAHKDIEVFNAVDGSQYSLQELQEDGIIAGPLPYSRGALGNALSHRELWQYAIEKGIAVTVCEDDVFLHDRFPIESKRLLNDLGADWDLVYWGWNFDSLLFAELPSGLSPCMMLFDQNALRRNKHEYLRASISTSTLRLKNAFGSVCYSISPAGAAKFLDYCFPLRAFTLEIPEMNFKLDNVALDVTMCSYFRQTSSWACFPPLALTDNDQSVSSVKSLHGADG